MSPTSAEESFRRYRESGDPRALAQVFDQLAPDLLVLARYLAPQGTEPEDLLQATFLTAMESADRFESGRPLKPWLAGVLANHARKALRARRTAAPADRPDGSPVADPRRQAELTELRQSLQQSLAGIPEPYRPVLSLYLLHGLSPKEIGASLGRSHSTVRTQIHRGLDILRRGLPAGLATSFAVIEAPARSLAAVREKVLAAAGERTLAAAWLVALVGGISMKKTATFVAFGLAAVLVVWLARDGGPVQPAPPIIPDPQASPMAASLDEEQQENARRLLVAENTEPKGSDAGIRQGSLLVRVRRAGDDAPIPDRWVTVIRANTPDGNRVFPLRQARTDPDGNVVFEDLEPGPYELRPILVPGGRPRVQVEAGVQVEHVFTVENGVRVEGQVVNLEGSAVPGASIYLDIGLTSHDWPVATADGRGRFEIPNVPEGARVGALAAGFAPSHHHPVQADAGGADTLTIVMRRAAATLRGVILDPDGAPVPHGFVAFQPMDLGRSYRDEDGRFWRPAQIQVLRANEMGSFASHEVPAEPLLIVGGATSSVDLVHAIEELDLDPGTEHYIELRTRRGGTIEGTVTRGGRPVPDLEVHAHPEGRKADLDDPVFLASQFDVSSAFTNRLGQYRLTGLRPGEYAMYAEGLEADGKLEVLELHWEETLQRDLFLKPQAKLLLRLVDAAGDPLPDWQITVHYRSVWPSAVSDADGEVRFTDFDEGSYTVLVESPSDRPESHHRYAALGVRDLVAQEEFHTIRVPAERMPSARVRARILDTEGRVPEAAALSIDARVLRLPQWGSVSADDRGFVASGLLPPGTYTLAVNARDHNTVRLGEKVLQPGEILDLGEIRLGR